MVPLWLPAFYYSDTDSLLFQLKMKIIIACVIIILSLVVVVVVQQQQ